MMWVLSLILSVATVVLWVRSHFRSDHCGRYIVIVEEHDELDRGWSAVSNLGQLYVAHYWWQQRYDAPEPGLKSGKFWVHAAVPPDPKSTGPAYFSRNLDTPTSRNRSRGFDLKIISVAHFTTYSWWKNDWSNRSFWAMTLPHWLLAVIFLILPGIAFWRRVNARRRQRMVENRQCPHCGYDLRASGEFCPECGKPVEVSAVKVSS